MKPRLIVDFNLKIEENFVSLIELHDPFFVFEKQLKRPISKHIVDIELKGLARYSYFPLEPFDTLGISVIVIVFKDSLDDGQSCRCVEIKEKGSFEPEAFIFFGNAPQSTHFETYLHSIFNLDLLRT